MKFLTSIRPVLVGLALLARPLLAQQPALPDSSTRATVPREASAGATPAPPLDAPVSRTAYRLGPGDVLNVSVFGDFNQQYTLTVGPEGSVMVPEAGVAKVLGLDLNDAEARIRDLVYRLYRNVEVSVTLAQVRTFKVFIVGDVPTPGVRLASAATRVSEVIPPANSRGAVRRNVLLQRASGDTIQVDLLLFVQTGDKQANPLLREGDVLRVPTIDETVEIFGRVAFPGRYEYRRGESLAALLSLANGAGDFPSDAADTIRLARFLNRAERQFISLPRADAMGARGRALLLQPFDAVFVPQIANFKQQRVAVVTGQVMRPGTYPIRPDTTTVRELVAMAGGFTPEASLVRATLRRAAPSTPATELERVRPELLSPAEQQILQIRSRGGSDNVVINFERLFANGENALDQPVRAGDVLTVPTKSYDVAVLGAVLQPGLIRYVQGWSVRDFVAQAGGYSRRADVGNAVVLKARLGARLAAKEAGSLEPGDQIIVPFKREKTRLERIQTIQGVIGTVSGLILSVIGLRQVF